MNQKKNNSNLNINDLKVIWRIVAKNWYIPIVFISIFYLIGYFYVYKLTNIYQASVELLKSNDSFYKENVITDNSGYYGGSQSFIDNSNEIRIVKSFDLMKATIDKLKDNLQVSYYLVGRVRTTEQFTGTPFKLIVSNINSSLIENKINVKILDYDTYQIKYILNGNEVTKTGKFEEAFIDLDFNFIIKRDGNFNRNTISSLSNLDYQVIVHDINTLVYSYQNALGVLNPDYTNVLVITLTDIIPERAVMILDTLSRLYINKSLNTRFEINERTISYIDKQLDQVRASLKEVEDTMQDYKKDKAILDLDWERNDFFQKLSSYDGQKSKLKLKIDAINDLEKYIIEDKDPQFLPPNIYLVDNDNFLITSVNELYKAQIELSILLSSSKEINPNIIEIKQRIKKLKQNMLVYLNNTRNASYKIIENINGEITSYVGEIKTIPQKQREILNIQRRVTVNEEMYNFLLQKKANTKISKATIVPDIKVIDSPRNKGVVSPDKKAILSKFTATGLVISLIIVMLRFLFFSRIQSAEELAEKTHLPIIGDLPLQKNVANTGILVDESPNSILAESFRTLRTNLQYVILNSHKKTILVTSNGPGEGKTFTTINIAAILAKGGKKVVMLELDLHKPRIQKALVMNAEIGISTFMIGENTLDEIVKPTQIKGLYAILSGPIPPNPSDLVLSEKLKELIDYAKQNFDYVLIDTPPIGMLSDAAYLMQYSDINLFVINTKFATKHVLNLFHKTVSDNSIKDVYLVLNGVKRRRGK